jgi:hypothetical protein
MRNATLAPLALALAVFVSGPMLAPGARADVNDQSTKFTISAPLRIPGNKDLPPGTYWIKLIDPDVHRNVVGIYNADQSLEGIFLTIPAQRSTYSGTEFTLKEQSRTLPDVLLKWFYPGDATGHEFIYSPSLEKKLNSEATINLFSRPA